MPRASRADKHARRREEGRAQASAALQADPSLAGTLPIGPAATVTLSTVAATVVPMMDRRDRWHLPSYGTVVTYPPVCIRRTLGGIVVTVTDRDTIRSHVVFAAADGFQWVPSIRRQAWTKVRSPASAHCQSCRSMECAGAEYALAILAAYLPEPPGYEERYA